MSHPPATAARQTVVFGMNASAGHAAPAPGQVSCTSPAPAAARHTVPAAYFWQAPAPSQTPLLLQVDAASFVQLLLGSLPVAMLPQTPSPPPPFLAAEQAWQPLVHEVSQQKP